MPKKRSEYPSIITPRGVVAWASLNEPDYEYKKDGEFHVRLRPDVNDAQFAKLVELTEGVRDEFYTETVAKLTAEKKGALLKKLHKVDTIKAEIDRETGDETGEMVFRAGMKHHIEIKNGPKAGTSFDKVPDFFNAQGVRLKNPPKIGSGSELKLSVKVIPYLKPDDGSVGASLQLEGVQILKVVSGGQRSASDYGFGAEDGDDISDDNGGFEPASGYAGTDDSADF